MNLDMAQAGERLPQGSLGLHSLAWAMHITKERQTLKKKTET